jgi:2',3'-cyclic-nucleotide 2'-phosphodiesterase (5'-nucleotidase family)
MVNNFFHTSDANRCRTGALLLVGLITGACASSSTSNQSAAADTKIVAEEVAASEADSQRSVRILFTTDEHGWLQPYQNQTTKERQGGVVQVYSQLKSNENLGAENVLLLSAGDMWTGPFESTILKGRPMVKAFNYMGYAAATVGNHEFDFGIEALEKREKEANFPFLAANIHKAGTQTNPSWATPSILRSAGGISWGIIGLANIDTDKATDTINLKGLSFESYEETLKREVPQLRKQGADEVIVLLHDRIEALTQLAPLLTALNVRIVAGGHAHRPERHVEPGLDNELAEDDILFCNAGPYMRTYCRIDLVYQGKKLIKHDLDVISVASPLDQEMTPPDPFLAEIIQNAVTQSKAQGEEILASCPQPISRKEHALGQLILDSWLHSLSHADAAITNAGAIRQDLPAGTIRMRDVISVMPFENELIITTVSGLQLKEALSNRESVVAGITYRYKEVDSKRVVTEVRNNKGVLIKDEDKLKVIVNSFMYRGGDGYQFATYDPAPENTTLDWRLPFVMYLRSQQETGKGVFGRNETRSEPAD